jgi:ribosomal protein S4E
MENRIMTVKPSSHVRDGDHCDVIGGTHKGKAGTVRDIKTGKTGHISITVVQSNGVRFKTLAKNVSVDKARTQDGRRAKP